jgi:hypothetical protein
MYFDIFCFSLSYIIDLSCKKKTSQQQNMTTRNTREDEKKKRCVQSNDDVK